MRVKLRTISSMALAAVVLLALGVEHGPAYELYRQSGGSCAECHPGLVHEGPLHVRHINMTENCLLCHIAIGDVPRTFTSGDPEGQGCRGCHGVDNGTENAWGIGLVRFHTNVGAPPDQSGRTCAHCHSSDLQSHESDTPIYYLRADVNVKDPCLAMLPDGEDYNGNGRGLDNDGDLAYEMDDSDCSSAGVEEGGALQLRLLSISPNPVVSGGAGVRFSLATASDVTIGVYTMAGQLILREQRSSLSPGLHTFRFRGEDLEGRKLPSGVYAVRIGSRGALVQGKVTLLE